MKSRVRLIAGALVFLEVEATIVRTAEVMHLGKLSTSLSLCFEDPDIYHDDDSRIPLIHCSCPKTD